MYSIDLFKLSQFSCSYPKKKKKKLNSVVHEIRRSNVPLIAGAWDSIQHVFFKLTREYQILILYKHKLLQTSSSKSHPNATGSWCLLTITIMTLFIPYIYLSKSVIIQRQHKFAVYTPSEIKINKPLCESSSKLNIKKLF